MEDTQRFKKDGLAREIYEISLSNKFKFDIKGELTRRCFMEILDNIEKEGKINLESIERTGYKYSKEYIKAVEESPAPRDSPALEELKKTFIIHVK